MGGLSAAGSAAVTTEAEAFSTKRKIGFVLGPLLFLLMLWLPAPDGMSAEAWRAAAIMALMVVWWVTEAIPLAVTSLVPLIAFPFLDVLTLKQTAAPYASPVIFLFLGGFMLALAMERWHLHQRIALNIVNIVGHSADTIIGGFMLATAFISMWISNTAATVMLLPICLSVIHLLMRTHVGKEGELDDHARKFAIAMLLGLAYSASIGGVATLIGTPPNAVFVAYMQNTYNVEISFMDWFSIGLPVSIVMLAAAWFVLVKVMFRNQLGGVEGSHELIEQELKELGPMSPGEKRVAVIFVITASLWIFRQPLNDLIPFVELNDIGIAMLAALALFLTPVDFGKGIFVMDWKAANKLPWGVLLLFGGGLSLAGAVGYSGLAGWMGDTVSQVGEVPVLALVVLLILLMVFLTEVMSNVATIMTFLPVIAVLSSGFEINPMILMIPAVIAVSYAFMMPVATAPNALVFSSGLVSIGDMCRAGLVLNLIAVVVVALVCYILLPIVFGIDVTSIPAWAISSLDGRL